MHGEFNAFDGALTTALARWGLPVTPTQLRRLHAHFEAVIETNRVMNLTRITDPVEAAVMHYADSLALLLWIRDRNIAVQTVLDVGTGAGFPALPLAVMRPDWSVTAIDATRKKIDFVKRTAAAIGLTNLHCEHAHSQHWEPSAISRQPSGVRFELVVFRALTTLAKSLEQTSRYVARGGWLVAYKTASVESTEQDAAARLALKLRVHSPEPYLYDLELGNEKLDRSLYIYHRQQSSGGDLSQEG